MNKYIQDAYDIVSYEVHTSNSGKTFIAIVTLGFGAEVVGSSTYSDQPNITYKYSIEELENLHTQFAIDNAMNKARDLVSQMQMCEAHMNRDYD